MVSATVVAVAIGVCSFELYKPVGVAAQACARLVTRAPPGFHAGRPAKHTVKVSSVVLVDLLSGLDPVLRACPFEKDECA